MNVYSINASTVFHMKQPMDEANDEHRIGEYGSNSVSKNCLEAGSVRRRGRGRRGRRWAARVSARGSRRPGGRRDRRGRRAGGGPARCPPIRPPSVAPEVHMSANDQVFSSVSASAKVEW